MDQFWNHERIFIIRKKAAYSKHDGENDNTNKRIISFKIDIRFRYHCHHHRQVIDIGTAEAAKNNNDDKVTVDLGKLLREGKDVLDRLLMTTLEAQVASELKGFMIQSTGKP